MTLLTIFYVIGIVFGIIFLFMNGAVFFGADHDMHSDFDVNADVDSDHGGFEGHGLFGEALTIRSLVNFLTFFGWTGVFGLEQGWNTWVSILIAVVVSFVLTIVFAAIMFAMKKLQSTQDDVDKDDVLNQTATVYLVIPGKDKKGKIQLSIRGAYQTIDALSETGEKLDTGSQVTVTDFISDNLVKVTKIN